MFLIIILFLYLYNPPILPFNTIHILVLISIMYFILKKENIKRLFKESKSVIFVLLIIVSIIYMMIILCTTGKLHNFGSILNYVLILENVIFTLFIFSYCKNNKINVSKFLNYVVYVGLIQAILALISFLFKGVQNYFVQIIINGGYGYNGIVETLTKNRMFGLSSNLTFSTPILQGFLAIIALWKLIFEKKYINLAIIPLLTFSAIINSRTSIVVMIVGILCLILNTLDKKNIKKLVLIIIVTLIIITGLNKVLIDDSNETFKWINTGISEIKEFTKGKDMGYFSALENFWIWPKGLDFIAGTGESIFWSTTNMRSDVGFVNNIWLGGILLCIFSYSAILYLIAKTKIYNNKMTKFLILYEILIFIIMNVKGNFISYNNVLNLFILLFGVGNLYFYDDIKQVKKEEKTNNEDWNNNP